MISIKQIEILKRSLLVAVSSKNRGRPQSDLRGNKIKESDVQRMSTADYEKNQDAIMEAVRGGDFIYDVSGSAR